MEQNVTPTSKPKTSGMAILSFILSFIPLVSLVGIVLGIVSVATIRKKKQELTGQGMAIASIVIGGLNFITTCFIFPLLFSSLSSSIKNEMSSKQNAPQNQTKPYVPQTRTEPTPSETEPSTESGLTVVSFNWATEEYGSRYLVGTVKNNTDKQYSYVQVEFNLYDNSGAQVGSTADNINNLEPHGTWKFKAMVMEEKATRAKLKGITGF